MRFSYFLFHFVFYHLAICLPLGRCKGAVSGLQKMGEILTSHMSPQCIAVFPEAIADEAYLSPDRDQPITKACQPTEGDGTEVKMVFWKSIVFSVYFLFHYVFVLIILVNIS